MTIRSLIENCDTDAVFEAALRMEKRIAVLEKALETYGRHWSGCGFDGQPCDCGLDAAIKDAP